MATPTNSIGSAPPPKRHRVTVTIVLDLIHVLEYLWKAAYVFYP